MVKSTYDKKMAKKLRSALALIVKAIGYDTVAKKIPKMPLKLLEKNLTYIVEHEIRVGKGCKMLTNPLTRKRSKNPMRPKYLKARVMFKQGVKRLRQLEK